MLYPIELRVLFETDCKNRIFTHPLQTFFKYLSDLIFINRQMVDLVITKRLLFNHLHASSTLALLYNFGDSRKIRQLAGIFQYFGINNFLILVNHKRGPL